MKKSSKIAWIFLAFAALAVFGGHNTSSAKVYTIKHSTKNVYTKKYQQEVTKKLSRMKKSSYTIEKPLLVKNPYGTLSTSIYFYARSAEGYYAEYTIIAKGASTVKGICGGGGKTLRNTHEYLIPGLASGRTNQVELRFYDGQGTLKKTKRFTVKMPKDKVIPAITKVKKGSSQAALSDGFFAMFGHDKSTATNIYYYDNKGKSRGRTVLNDYRTDRILTVDGKWVFSYDRTRSL